ncbi:MAG: hypothetical protein ABIH00_10180 [Armatimonadota bacterium]
MIYLGFLLHIYQPPEQYDFVLKQIVEECYRPLFDLILRKPKARFTVNINWSLTELLLNNGYADVVESIKKCLDAGKIEITGTAAYHVILPLIPEDLRRRQIRINYENNKKIFGKNYTREGFFPPEMAFGHEIVSDIKVAGYKWTITEDIPFGCIHQEAPYNYIPSVDDLAVFLRSNHWSNSISFDKDAQGHHFRGDVVLGRMLRELGGWFKTQNGYMVLAMDGETFGHHVKGYIENFLEPFLDALERMEDKIELVKITDLMEKFPKLEKSVPPGSWSTTSEDFWRGDFYPLWKSHYNKCHHILWELTDIAINSVRRLLEDFDKSLNSCTYWWCPPSPDSSESMPKMTKKGIDMLLNIIKETNSSDYKKALQLKEEFEGYFEKESKKEKEKVIKEGP